MQNTIKIFLSFARQQVLLQHIKIWVHSLPFILRHNVALATYFYVFSGDSTRFLPTAACAGHRLQVPAGDFPLICTLSSTPVQRNQSSIVNAAFLLDAVKNPPGYTIQVRCKPYISGCSHQNHQFEPCFGVAN